MQKFPKLFPATFNSSHMLSSTPPTALIIHLNSRVYLLLPKIHYGYRFCWHSVKWSTLTCALSALITRKIHQPILYAAAPLIQPMFTENTEDKSCYQPLIYQKSLGLHTFFPLLKFLNQLFHTLCNQHKIISI